MTQRPYHRPAWATRPAVVIGSGPSLSDEQLQLVRQAREALRVHVIAVNNTIERVPWADVSYFGDYTALCHYLPKLKPLTKAEWVTTCRAGAERWKLTHVRPSPNNGMSLNVVHLNGNSGAQAVNTAAAFGATKVILIGFDMRNSADGKAHWFGQHPLPLITTQLYPDWMHKFAYLAIDAQRLGVDLVNCTPDSAMTCLRMGNLEEELALC